MINITNEITNLYSNYSIYQINLSLEIENVLTQLSKYFREVLHYFTQSN